MTPVSPASFDWVHKAGRTKIKSKAKAIYEAFDDASEVIDMKDGQLLQIVIFEIMVQCQDQNGLIRASELDLIASHLSELP